MTKEEQNKECNACGGTGQVSFFKGVSRFLLSTEECPECAGTGFQLDHNIDKSKNSKAANSLSKKGKTKKKN